MHSKSLSEVPTNKKTKTKEFNPDSKPKKMRSKTKFDELGDYENGDFFNWID